MNDDLKLIKKHYGEDMMHFCREYFSTILDKKQGLLYKLLNDNFNKNKFLYKDIVDNRLEMEFKNYIYNLVEPKPKEEVKIIKTPEELMREVGYILYKCKTENDVQQFKKYYAKNEELCTFHGGRLNSCHVFFAVKENVDEIKRKNFDNPRRQDEYGTSVISIQFTKDSSHTLSIKNRYNHTVANPDATFSNNLDNIIEGLTDSFAKFYGMEQANENNSIEIPGYVKANDGKYYKYNQEINNIYYCTDNIIIDNFEVNKYDKSRYIISDYFIIDIKEKTIQKYDDKVHDGFVSYLDVGIVKIEVKKNQDYKDIIITNEDNSTSTITINNINQIIHFKSNNDNNFVLENFLYHNYTLKSIEMPKLHYIDECFLMCNQDLTTIDFPNVEKIKDDFLFANEKLSHINLPKLIKTGARFLNSNKNLTEIEFPLLEHVGSDFIYYNENIKKLNLPKLKHVENYFLFYNSSLKEIDLPNLKYIGQDFLSCNTSLEVLNLPNVVEILENFLEENTSLIEMNLPKLTYAGDGFLKENTSLEVLNLPNVKEIGDYALYHNENITNINIPNIEMIGKCVLCGNKLFIEKYSNQEEEPIKQKEYR